MTTYTIHTPTSSYVLTYPRYLDAYRALSLLLGVEEPMVACVEFDYQ